MNQNTKKLVFILVLLLSHRVIAVVARAFFGGKEGYLYFSIAASIVMMALQVAVAIWLYKDAVRNEVKASVGWALLALLNAPLGLAAYVFMGKQPHSRAK